MNDPVASWMSSAAVRMHLAERATGDPLRDWLSGWAPQYFGGVNLRVLLLGDDSIRSMLDEWPFVGRVDAGDAQESDAYDVVISNLALHRAADLEGALGGIERAMKDDSFLIVNEYTGPRQFIYSEDVAAMVEELAFAIDAKLNRRPPDAARSDELLPMLYERFDVLDMKRMGGTLLQHLVAGAEDFDDVRAGSIIEMLCTFEGALVDSGAIPSAFNILAARKRGSGAIPVQRPAVTSETAPEKDPDPLQMRRRVKSEGRPAGVLDGWHLRVLRIVLASTQPRRAKLFEEQPMHAAMERFRFAVARTSAFDWIASRYRAYGRDANILALLDTFDRLAPE